MRNDFDFETLVKPGVEAFEFWISFFPTAPLFGVDWRFADMVGVKSADEIDLSVVAEPEPSVAADAALLDDADVEDPRVEAVEAELTSVAQAEIVDAEAVEASGSVEVPEPVSAPEPVVAAVAEPVAPVEEAAPVDESEPTKPAGLFDAAPADADDLKLIKGIGPGLERQLNGLGVYRFDQIAGFSEADLIWVDERLTSFKGRCFRDDWIGQAASKIG